MLRELHIANLAVIEDVTIELAEGLNVFTGQTGAGKSLILGAFELLLGLRSTAGAREMIRTGAGEARVSGVFEVHEARKAAEVSALADQAIGVGEQVLVTRKLFASGRSSVTINGRPATAAMARAIGEHLVDIHGQHDHQFLLKPGNQLLLLDAVAGCEMTRRRYAERFADLRDLRQTKQALDASAALRRQQLELYEFQAGEIDDAEPTAGEFAELDARHKVLANLTRLKREAGGAHAALHEAEGSVSERLQAIAHHLIDLADVDEQLAPVAEQVRVATLSVQEASYELGRYADRLELDPGEAGEVEQRLNVLNRLIAKYGDGQPSDDPLAAVLEFRGRIGEQIAQLRGQEGDLSEIDGQIAAAQRDLEALGAELTAARTRAGKRLCPKVEAQLKVLGMGEARFRVSVRPGEPGPSGADAVEFIAQTNPGQDPRPLRKIASGGELSRMMLAIKSITAGSDRISVLVFDEIDANIGGRLGSVIGKKLRGLAGSDGERSSGHQVICITHLPQIAAFGDRHFRIAKSVAGSGKSRQTRTEVAVLDGKPRIEELAEMMAGAKVTPTSRRQAKELVAAAG